MEIVAALWPGLQKATKKYISGTRLVYKIHVSCRYFQYCLTTFCSPGATFRKFSNTKYNGNKNIQVLQTKIASKYAYNRAGINFFFDNGTCTILVLEIEDNVAVPNVIS